MTIKNLPLLAIHGYVREKLKIFYEKKLNDYLNNFSEQIKIVRGSIRSLSIIFANIREQYDVLFWTTFK